MRISGFNILNEKQVTILADTRDMTEDEFTEMRRTGIGGSDAATVMGMNQWASRMGLFVDKKNMLPDRDESENINFKYGKRMEEPIRKWFQEDIKEVEGKQADIADCPFCYRSDVHDFMIANIDGLVSIDGGPWGGIEIKARDRIMAKHYANEDEVMDSDYCQVQHYMAVLDLPFFYVIPLLGKRLIWRYVPRNQEFIGNLIEQEHDFWHNFVQKDQMPAPAGLYEDDKILQLLYPESDDELTVDLPELEPSLVVREESAKEIKKHSTTKEYINQLCKIQMKEAKWATSGDYKLTWSRFDRETFDIKKFRQDNPELYLKYAKRTNSGRFTVKNLKE